jgi:poly(3-hydroxybutyrate) depolymerase
MAPLRIVALMIALGGCTALVDGGGGGDGALAEDAAAGDGPAGGDGGVDAAGAGLPPGQSTISVTVAGRARTAILYVPATATGTSQLVIALHGNGDTAANFLAASGIKRLADQDGTVLVVPQGVRRDVFVTLANQTVPGIDWDGYNTAAQGNIDVPLLDELRTRLVASGQLDARHVFVLGYSQGGYLAFAYGMFAGASLSCTAVLAAASGFGGAAGDPLITGAARKLPVVLQIGTNDPAFGRAQTTATTLQNAAFPTRFEAVAGAGHVPIPGDVAVPWSYCRGHAL